MSAIALDLGGIRPDSVFSRRSAVARVRKARSAGVTVFDLAHGEDASVALGMLAEALPDGDPELVALVGPSRNGRGPPARPEAADPGGLTDPESAVRALLQSVRSRRGCPRLVVEWPEVPGPSDSGAVVAALARAVAENEILDFSFPLDRGTAAVDPLGAGLRSVRLSLLDAGALPDSPASAPPGPPGWVVHDPFSNGRLDGTALAGLADRPRRPNPPARIQDLRAALEPVLRLGYLTEHRGRTLAQAALRFCLAWPWVVTAVVPVPDASRFDEVIGYARAPPFTPAELARSVAPKVPGPVPSRSPRSAGP